uniref:Uncharacterized protein LOC100375994 n=1 Tax=Saccoglossus kowalevskii TaxID=10224 RepID=A0ABM0MY09_SACKO|nr:PREDICTED: uncharacterized protein LOC100375994 [Saccoglossus kowalevskii]
MAMVVNISMQRQTITKKETQILQDDGAIKDTPLDGEDNKHIPQDDDLKAEPLEGEGEHVAALTQWDVFESEFKGRPRLPNVIDNDLEIMSHTKTQLLEYFPGSNADGLYLTWSLHVNTKGDLLRAMANDLLMIICGDVKLKGNLGEKGTYPIMAEPVVADSDISLAEWLDKISTYTNKAIKLNFYDTDSLHPAFEVLQTLQYQIHAPLILRADILVGPNGDTNKMVNGVNFISDANGLFPNSIVSLGWRTHWTTDSKEVQYTWDMVIDMAKYCTRLHQPISFSVRAVFARKSIRQLKWLVSLSSKFTITIFSPDYDIVSMSELSIFRRSLPVHRVLYDVPVSFIAALREVQPNTLQTPGEKMERNLWHPQPFDTKSFVFLGEDIIAFTGPNSWLTSKMQYRAELETGKQVEISGIVQFAMASEQITTDQSKLDIHIRSTGVDPPEPDSVLGVRIEIVSDGTLRVSSHNLAKAGTYNPQTTATIPSHECYYFHIVDAGETAPITVNIKWADCEAGVTTTEHNVQLSLTVPYEATQEEEFYITINGSNNIHGAATLLENLVVR